MALNRDSGGIDADREFRGEWREKVLDLREKAQEMTGRYGERIEERGDEGRMHAADAAHDVADAIRAAGSTLRDRHSTRLGGYVDDLADQVERFSGYLRDHDLRGLMGGLEDAARRSPAAFLGGTLAAGLVAGRFLRASEREGQARIDPHHAPVPLDQTPKSAAGYTSRGSVS